MGISCAWVWACRAATDWAIEVLICRATNFGLTLQNGDIIGLHRDGAWSLGSLGG